MINVDNLYKSFNGKEVLMDISTTFEKGKTNLILGASGSGKTVLMKCIVGLHDPDKGSVSFDNRNFTALDYKKKKIIRQEMGMLFQGSALFDSQTVEENIAFPIKVFTKKSPQEIHKRVNECLERVNLEKVNHLYPSEVSGGMKKRVGIARAIALNPKYLFVDEPNSGLDPQTSIVIDNLIKEITKEFNITTVINTHDMNSVFEMGDNILFLHKGKKWWEGSTDDIRDSDNEELKRFVFASRFTREMHGKT